MGELNKVYARRGVTVVKFIGKPLAKLSRLGLGSGFRVDAQRTGQSARGPSPHASVESSDEIEERL